MSALLTCPYDHLVVLDIESSADEIVKLAYALYNTRTQRVEENLVQVSRSSQHLDTDTRHKHTISRHVTGHITLPPQYHTVVYHLL